MGESQNISFFIAIYVVVSIAIFIILTMAKIIQSTIIMSLITSLFLVLFLYLFRQKSETFLPNKGLLRYSMLCNNCNWEWMSNVSREGNPPKTCPNCHQNNLQVTGWRTVKAIKKQETDLRKFFK